MIGARAFSCFLFIFLLTPFSLHSQLLPIDHSQWDQLLKKYVHQGLVDYDALLLKRNLLDEYLEQLENYPIDSFSELSREDRIAFWINLYNASVLRMVLDHYPIRRLDDIPAALEVREINVIGEYFSLSDLFNEVLRRGFRDERILTALISGRMDSPRFLKEAYVGKKLEDQLDRAAAQFAGSDALNQIQPGSKKLYLSPLFQKFGSDFLVNYSGDRESRYSEQESAVISFLLRHLKNPEKRIFLDSAKYKIDYLPEDPRLNAVSMSKPKGSSDGS